MQMTFRRCECDLYLGPVFRQYIFANIYFIISLYQKRFRTILVFDYQKITSFSHISLVPSDNVEDVLDLLDSNNCRKLAMN